MEKHRFALAAAAAIAALACSEDARAYVTKHTPSGDAVVRWRTPNVEFVVSPDVEASVPGARDAVANALARWSAVPGAPHLTAKDGDGTESVGVDGKNVVVYAPDYPAAKGALAITLLSFDASTGAVVDADIVINGRRGMRLEVLAEGAEPDDPESALVATDGAGGQAAAVAGAETFDLFHVFAHEAGHALALGDDANAKGALMFPFTRPGDATVRAPTEDDEAGLAAIYGTERQGAAAAAPAGASCAIGAPGAPRSVAPLLASCIAALVARRRRARKPLQNGRN